MVSLSSTIRTRLMKLAVRSVSFGRLPDVKR